MKKSYLNLCKAMKNEVIYRYKMGNDLDVLKIFYFKLKKNVYICRP